MKPLTPLLYAAFLTGCACTHGERVTWPDHSEKSVAWFCSREKDAIRCLDGHEVLELAIQKMPQEMIDQIKLQAPAAGDEK